MTLRQFGDPDDELNDIVDAVADGWKDPLETPLASSLS